MTESSGWGVIYLLQLPTEVLARAAAEKMAGLNHRLVAVRSAHAAMEPELAGWWQVCSLAVYPEKPDVVDAFLENEKRRVAELARTHGGFQWGGGGGHPQTLEMTFPRVDLVHEQPGAVVPLPSPMLSDPLPPATPRWEPLQSSDPTALAQAVRAVADRTGAPDAIQWLLDEPADTEWEFGFMGELFDSVAHQGTCDDDTAEAVPFVAELICTDQLSAGDRLELLLLLLSLVTSGPALLVSLADRTAALGIPDQETSAISATRQAIVREVPRLLRRWGQETAPARHVLAALANFADSPHPPLDAPPTTTRSAALALGAALLTHQDQQLTPILDHIATWTPQLQAHLSNPNIPRRPLALTTLSELVSRDAQSALP